MLADAIRDYHELLSGGLALETDAQLAEVQRERGLAFGERPLASVLRPRFLTPALYRFVLDRVARLLPAFDKAHRAALDNAGFRKQFTLTADEERLFAHDPGFACPYPTARLDAFFADERELRFTEFNAETPAGAGYNDALSDIFLALPVMREFLRRYRVTPLPTRPGVLHALLDAYKGWRGTSEIPSIAILDWCEVPTYSEFILFRNYFKSHNVPCVIADPREVEYKGGKLYAGGTHVTLIYKRVLIGELIERGGLEQPAVRAVLDGAACMVNPFRCKPLYKKASFAVLTDERNEHLFDAGEREAIAAHIPWTRLVEERRTHHNGREVDLISHIVANRERLVLKPNDDYGGKGIVLGWDATASEWLAAIQTALATPYIVQERVSLPTEPYPSVVDGRLEIIDRMFDTAPYVCHGEYADGCLTRISTAKLLNVTAGGGSTVPTLLVEKR